MKKFMISLLVVGVVVLPYQVEANSIRNTLNQGAEIVQGLGSFDRAVAPTAQADRSIFQRFTDFMSGFVPGQSNNSADTAGGPDQTTDESDEDVEDEPEGEDDATEMEAPDKEKENQGNRGKKNKDRTDDDDAEEEKDEEDEADDDEREEDEADDDDEDERDEEDEDEREATEIDEPRNDKGNRGKGNRGNRGQSKDRGKDKRADDRDGSDKVTICHAPPGNPDKAHTITVGENAVQEHLDHGDRRGACSNN